MVPNYSFLACIWTAADKALLIFLGSQALEIRHMPDMAGGALKISGKYLRSSDGRDTRRWHVMIASGVFSIDAGE